MLKFLYVNKIALEKVTQALSEFAGAFDDAGLIGGS